MYHAYISKIKATSVVLRVITFENFSCNFAANFKLDLPQLNKNIRLCPQLFLAEQGFTDNQELQTSCRQIIRYTSVDAKRELQVWYKLPCWMLSTKFRRVKERVSGSQHSIAHSRAVL